MLRNGMWRLCLWLLCVCSSLLSSVAVHAEAADAGGYAGSRIAVVNVSRLLDQAPQAKAASEQLKAEYSPRELQLDAEQKRIQQLQDMLQRDTSSFAISADEKLQRERSLRKSQRAFSRKLEDFREDLRSARDRAFEGVQDQIFKAIGRVRQQQKIDLVLKESQYVAASDRIDITPQVLNYLQSQFNATVPAPESTDSQPSQ